MGRLIARCRGPADIVDALSIAQERNLEVSVRGGGHSVAGRAVGDDVLMVDLLDDSRYVVAWKLCTTMTSLP